MNIDIVNRQLSNEFDIAEKEVARITNFYWQNIKQHIYSYNPTPINVPNLFVLYPDKYLLKHVIREYILKIRKVQSSKVFIKDSIKQLSTIEKYKKVLRKFLQIRKSNKFTN